MRGSAALFPELVKAFDLVSIRAGCSPADRCLQLDEQQCTERDFFKYKPEHIEWLKKRGCEWVHPDLNPGDTVFWDSREAHTAEPPEAGRPRMAVCELIVTSLAASWLTNTISLTLQTPATNPPRTSLPNPSSENKKRSKRVIAPPTIRSPAFTRRIVMRTGTCCSRMANRS